MNLMTEFRKDVSSILSRYVPGKHIQSGLERPPENIGSDLAFPCFVLARERKANPAELAHDISRKLSPSGLVGEVSFYGPYINFYIDWSKAGGILLKEVLSRKKSYGKQKPRKERVMVEYSAPNTNKPLHLGHLRNQSLGMAISNLLEATGFKVIRANLYSNRGSHICKSMLAYRKWGKGNPPDIKPDHFVGKFYVMFERKKTKALEKEVQEMLRKWESGDKETRALWRKMDSWAVKGFRQTYERFGSEFDAEFRESEFWDKADPVIEKGLKKGVFKREKDGSVLADLEKHNLGKKVIRRSDDTSIYITNDLALTLHKFRKFRLDRAIWVVASEQNHYFRQLFKIFELLGYPWSERAYHLAYGMVSLPEGRMKSREGRVVDADDLIDELQELARKEIRKREKGLPKKEMEERSLQIGLAAIKYYLLRNDAIKDMRFDPKESISFEGETGPYLQYSYARAMSILRKAGKARTKFDSGSLTDEKEISLLRAIADFPDTITRATEDLKPHYIAGYVFDLATKFNEFYQSVPVLKADDVSRPARLALVQAVAQVLDNGLRILGIEPPDRM